MRETDRDIEREIKRERQREIKGECKKLRGGRDQERETREHEKQCCGANQRKIKHVTGVLKLCIYKVLKGVERGR